ncbi:MAG TPA: bifunctional oligoribonuclease/PAP phosphatase NrnA [Candidatus Paceibacterota bacterium]
MNAVSVEIKREIDKAKSIILHCHPSPDPDSVGSVLAMKFGLEQLGKKVTAIQGDSEIPNAFMHFPGAGDIVKKNFGQIDLRDFDLFIILDASSPEMISQIKIPTFPLSIRTIVIDHHATNKSYADINLIDISSPATALILFQLFRAWKINITPEIATNLFVGIYTDTGGFRYSPTDYADYRVLQSASELAKIAPDFTKTIFIMENSNKKESVYFQALALNSIKTFHNENLVISFVSNKELKNKNINDDSIAVHSISNILKSVVGWNIAVSMIEREPNIVKISCRTRDSQKYDVSKLASALGGGGHKVAAGATLLMPLDSAVKKVVETVKIIYNL